MSIAEISMNSNMQRLNVISNNLANAKTTAYKRKSVVNKAFSVVLSNIENTAGNAVTIRGLSPTTQYINDMSGGAVETTNHPLDLVIAEPNGYFVVNSKSGLALTRKGNFKVSPGGLLSTSSGLVVMGVSGTIRLSGNNPTINQNGIVFENNKQVGELLLVESGKPAAMKSLGNGLYKTSERNITPSSSIHVRQGYLEASNVALMKEMVDMMQLLRHFEASQKLLVSYDQMIGQAINSIGDV